MALSDFLLKKIKEVFPFEPTPCQQGFFEAFAAFTVSRDDVLIVNGYAGTGKTEAMGAIVKALAVQGRKFVLMAPTGRAAKVLSAYTACKACTIHKHIYRQKSMDSAGGRFVLDYNTANDTIYIVDEASLIGNDSSSSVFGSGNLLSDLLDFIRQGKSNKLVLMGDNAQLPPVLQDRSPALDPSYVGIYASPRTVELHTVVRQAGESGILHNATIVRDFICKGRAAFPQLELEGFSDIERITGGELIECLDSAISRYGIDEVVVLCRSNKRTIRYNLGIRAKILYREEPLVRGDRLMVVKNCYNFGESSKKPKARRSRSDEDDKKLDFIANGDIAELISVSGDELRYGLHFADATLSFPDYDRLEIRAKIITDTLTAESASLPSEKQKELFEGVMAGYADISNKRRRMEAVREDPYYNALQIKYSTAITCHKSQGGQWSCVFIDNAFWREDILLEDLRWLYTALTRATEKVYLVNFNPLFFN